MPAWTDQKTWVTDEDILQADLNTYIRDDSEHLHDWLGRINDVDNPATATADSAGFTTTETTLLTMTVTLPTGGRDLKLCAQSHFQSTVAADVVTVRIKEGGTVLREIDIRLGAASVKEHADLWARISAPASGDHTYTLTAVRASGTGTITAKAAAAYPRILLAEAL